MGKFYEVLKYNINYTKNIMQDKVVNKKQLKVHFTKKKIH